MAADDGAAPVVALERRQLGEEAGREDARIAAHAAVSHRDDAVGVPAEKFDLRTHALAPQQRLVSHHEADGIAIRKCARAETDRFTLAALGVPVLKRFKAALFCERRDLRILRDDEHARKAFARNGIQRVFDERSPVPCRAEQFIFAEAFGISGRHEQAVDGKFLPHRDHPFLSVRFLHYSKGKRAEQAEKHGTFSKMCDLMAVQTVQAVLKSWKKQAVRPPRRAALFHRR